LWAFSLLSLYLMYCGKVYPSGIFFLIVGARNANMAKANILGTVNQKIPAKPF